MVHFALMPTARPAATPTLYEGDGFDPEFSRVLRIANPGAALRRALTFSPGADLPPAVWLSRWETWQRETFAARLAPVLAAVSQDALRGATREIQAHDLALDAILAPDQAERSILAGKRLLGQLAGARGEKFLTRLLSWSNAGALPTHFLTVYAVQGAIFRLSLRLLLPGYAYWEWTAATETCPPLGRPAPRFAEVIPDLQTIVQATFSSPFHAVDFFSPAVGVS